jgi:serine/threonine protein kinase
MTTETTEPSYFTLPANDERNEPLILKNMGKLGEGSYGKVYLVMMNGKKRALKVVDISKFESKSLEEMKNEINIIKKLKNAFPECSEFLLCYMDVSEDVENIYFISELMDLDLFDFINSDEYVMLPLNKKIMTTKTIADKVLNGLSILHSLGIIHRDIKPENILLKNIENPLVRIADFGLSCLTDESNECKGTKGTLDYISPYVLKSKVWTTRDDLYSLGVVLFMSLTGKVFLDSDKLKLFAKQKRSSEFLTKNFEVKIAYLKEYLESNVNEEDRNDAEKLFIFIYTVLNPNNPDRKYQFDLDYFN